MIIFRITELMLKSAGTTAGLLSVAGWARASEQPDDQIEQEPQENRDERDNTLPVEETPITD